jgi:hypothetical protein
MSERSPEDPRAVRNRLIWEDAFAWIGRIFATMLFMVGPALAGLWLDKKFGTSFLAAIGVMLGMALGIAALLILVNVKRPSLEDEVREELGAGRGTGADRTPRGRNPGGRNLGEKDASDGDQASP